MAPPFERSVFVNCPFDKEFEPILQAIAFCIVYLGFFPRLAPENADNSAARLDRIVELIRSSKYGVHDLSRCKSNGAGEYVRMNMPFELGIDHAARRFGKGRLAHKAVLVLDKDRYDYQKTLSDISGWDIAAHENDHQRAVTIVRSWLINQARARRVGSALIQGKYAAFQEWYWERELAAGSSEDEIRQYPTVEMIAAMHDWMDAGQPA